MPTHPTGVSLTEANNNKNNNNSNDNNSHVATATDSDSTTKKEMKELRESVRQLKLNIETSDMECPILASEIYTAQEQSAFLQTKCDDLEQSSTEQSGTTLGACTICCSLYDEAHTRMVIIKYGHVLSTRCCMTLNVDHRPGKSTP